ncbi:DUF5916 domain-containing protein [Candidatus Latescibacterota bacterium]
METRHSIIKLLSIWITVFLFAELFTFPISAETIENERYYRISDETVILYYDLNSDTPADISVEVSLDGGVTFDLKPTALSGDAGAGITPGRSKRIVWDSSVDIDPLPENFTARVVVGEAKDGADGPQTVSYEQMKRLSAAATQAPLTFDGFLNEPFWKDAVPATGFTQQEPVEGVPESETTEVRIMYDTENLYIGVICFDSDPSKIIANELSVDGDLAGDDNFSVVIDTFNDRRGGFYFSTNPNGARLDGKLTGSRSTGRRRAGDTRRRSDVNLDWNGIWDAAAKITDRGWSAEIIIPFKTLRFSDEQMQEWGINFKRDIARKNEQSLWTSWRRDDGLMQLTKAGVLGNLNDIKRGSKLEMIPYSFAGVEKDEGKKTDENLKAGIDIKYPLTSDLTLDFTTYTDFAQIEADQTIINLTRFDIRYPEKRDFFLEGAEIFNFSSHYTSPFNSREIGISEDVGQVPIIAGSKVTGKAGDYSLGLLVMQTGSEDVYPSTNYSVVRVKKDIFEKSYFGIIATNMYDTDKHSDQSFGVDFSYKTDTFMKNKNFEISADLAENKSGADSGTRAGRFSIRYPNDLVDMFLYYKNVGENYDPEMGFIQRSGVHQYMARSTISPRPDLPYIKQLRFVPMNLSVYNDISGRLESREIEISPLGFTTKSEDVFSFSLLSSYEYLGEDFNIFNNINIPVGDYEWWNYATTYQTNPNRRVSMTALYQWGDFYNGTKNTVETLMTVKFNKYFSVTSDIAFNELIINSHKFDTREYSVRLNSNVSTRLNARTYIQWNNEDKLANLNFRIHYIPKIGSDIYFVYNHLLGGYQDYRTTYNTAVCKIAYRITF